MKAKLDNPKILSNAIDIISELVTEVKIEINEFGLSIVAMDPSRASMVSFKIPASSFSILEADSESLGVNLDDLKKILRRASNASSIILERIENDLKITIEDKILREFSLNLLDIEGEETKPRDLEYSAHVEINSSDLNDSIEDCAIVADACSFIIEDGKFIIEAKGLNSARSEFSGDEAKIEGENCKSRYGLEYLQKFMKGSKISDKALLSFANSHPLKIDFKNPQAELSFLLAPRAEAED